MNSKTKEELIALSVKYKKEIKDKEAEYDNIMASIADVVSKELGIKSGDIIDEGGRGFLFVTGFSVAVNFNGECCVRAMCHPLTKKLKINNSRNMMRSTCLDSEVSVVFSDDKPLKFSREKAIDYLERGYRVYKIENQCLYLGETGVKLVKDKEDSEDYILKY